MKASVQYNDFSGSAAADISDHANLRDFLQKHKVDTDKFDPVGIEFYAGYSDFFSVSVICNQVQKSINGKPHLVSIGIEEKLTKDDFFDLFKRFNVIILQKHKGLEDHEIQEELSILSVKKG